jgi:two-component system nitrogen regulation response regulator NtrX
MADILVVDDEADIRDLIADILSDENHVPRQAQDADGALAAVEAAAPDLISLDIWLQGSRMDGIEILKTVKRNNPDIPVVIISGHGNIEIAVAAVKQGAYDFIEKPFNTDQLLVVVSRALEASRLRREIASLKAKEIASADMIGDSPGLCALRGKLDRVSKTGSRVLLTGPPGSGKEVAARYIHAKSDRSRNPFIVVNAASVEPQRMEEVLFGRERDGIIDQGLFERAHRGTLFLDEVAETPPGTQSKILRVLVDQSFTRVGGAETVRVDVRVISSTTRDLEALIAAGGFREDLFHRLNVVPIDVPPLSARREDIPLLSNYFLTRLAAEEGLAPRHLGADALAILQTYSWPGNVRQLRNLMEQFLILGGDTEEIRPNEISLRQDLDHDTGASLSAAMASMPLREARELFERDYLVAQINRFGGNISKTASFVGMERSALHRKLKSLGVVTTTRGGARVAITEEDVDDEATAD